MAAWVRSRKSKRFKILVRKRPPNYKKWHKASRRWKKANKAASKIQAKIARQRQNWQHQVATQIVSSNSLVATEKLTRHKLTLIAIAFRF